MMATVSCCSHVQLPRMSVAWAMPSRWTFSIPPIAEFVKRHIEGRAAVVDPFSGKSSVAHFRNDLAHGGTDAVEWLRQLVHDKGCFADAVIFDPPYSPRQVSECYKSIGKKVSASDTQNSRLYSECVTLLDQLLKPSGVALSFGWQSSGFGKKYHTVEIMLVQHGGAHNDTICVAQTKMLHQKRLRLSGDQP